MDKIYILIAETATVHNINSQEKKKDIFVVRDTDGRTESGGSTLVLEASRSLAE